MAQVLADTVAGVWLPPERRRVGLVFQDARLFPHMSVATNLRFGMRRAAPGPVRFDEVVDLLGIGALLDAPAAHAVRRRAPARGDRPSAAGAAASAADGRAAGQPGCRAQGGDPALSDAAEDRAAAAGHLRDARAGRGRSSLPNSMVLIEAGRVVGSGTLSEVAARADLPLAQRDDAGALLLCRVAEHDAARELTRLEGGGATLLGAAAGRAGRRRVPHPHSGARGDPGRPAARGDQPAQHRAGHGAPDRRRAARRSVLVEIASARRRPCWPGSRPMPSCGWGLSPGGPVLALIKSTSIEVLGTSSL